MLGPAPATPLSWMPEYSASSPDASPRTWKNRGVQAHHADLCHPQSLLRCCRPKCRSLANSVMIERSRESLLRDICFTNCRNTSCVKPTCLRTFRNVLTDIVWSIKIGTCSEPRVQDHRYPGPRRYDSSALCTKKEFAKNCQQKWKYQHQHPLHHRELTIHDPF